MKMRISDPISPIEKDLFETVVDTLPAAEPALNSKLSFRPILTVSTLGNILKLYNVYPVPTTLADR